MAANLLQAEKLAGPRKAAVFLLAMGEEFAASFFRKLDEKSIMEIGKHMSEITHISPDVLNSVMEEFLDKLENDSTLSVSGKSFLEQVVSKSPDTQLAQELYKLIGREKIGAPFDELSHLPTDKLINLLKEEHPQTIALILSYLQDEKAAEILGLLPEETRSDIALRIAQIGPVQDEVIKEVDEILRKDLPGLSPSSRKFDGVEKLASIMNRVDGKTEESVLSSIEKEDNDLATRVRQRMFVFEDLLQVNDKGFREILQQVDKATLIKGLKTASEEMKKKIFGNMSERAAEMLREDLEAMGPVRLREVEESQQEVIKVAKKLEGEGKISFGGKSKEDVFV